jgi:hypothetical protein
MLKLGALTTSAKAVEVDPVQVESPPYTAVIE